jgi:hypothetical protein
VADNAYIATSDITDKVLDDIATQAYVDEGNDAVEDLAEQKGVRDTGDIGDGAGVVHNRLKRYAIAWCCMRVAQDHMGSNNVNVPEFEKYVIKYQVYKKEVATLAMEITHEMVLNDVDETGDRASVQTGTIFRG